MNRIEHGVSWLKSKWYQYQLTERIWGFTIMELLVIVVIILWVAI